MDSNLQRLAHQQIEKHGIDRYPSVQSQMLKLVEEVGELAKAINRGDLENQAHELADVALSLGSLATKLGVPCLEDLVTRHVASDKRNFQRMQRKTEQ